MTISNRESQLAILNAFTATVSMDMPFALLIENGKIIEQFGNLESLELGFGEADRDQPFSSWLDSPIASALTELLENIEADSDSVVTVPVDDHLQLAGVGLGGAPSERVLVVVQNENESSNSKSIRTAYRELETKRHLFELALNDSTIGIWEADIEREDWIQTDDIEKILGFEPGELNNSRKRVRRLIHPEDVQTNERQRARHLTGEPNFTEMRLKTKSGEFRWYRVVGKSEKDANGKISRLAGVIIDIDRIKKAELEAELQVKRRDEYLAMLSHELRNPMTAINFAAAGLKTSGDLPENLNEFVSIISDQTMHMSRLLDDLLDVARITCNEIEVTPALHDIAAETANTVQGIRSIFERKHQKLELDIPIKPMYVHGDPARIKQAVTNLLDNASKYTPIGGEIHVCVRLEQDQITISVSDTGIGIAPEKLDHVFDLFYQVDQPMHRRSGGMGVGLFLVKQIAEAHGGTAEAESRGSGLGSKFTITFPANEASYQHDREAQEKMFDNVKLAFVEDNNDTRKVLSYLLESRGFVVTQFSDGETASVEIPELKPDVAVIDIGLPGKNGFDLAQEIRQHKNGKNMLLIALSGYGRDSDRINANVSGFDDHLVKPTRIDTLCNLIASKLDIKNELN